MPPTPPIDTDEFEAVNVPSPFPRKITTEMESLEASLRAGKGFGSSG